MLDSLAVKMDLFRSSPFFNVYGVFHAGCEKWKILSTIRNLSRKSKKGSHIIVGYDQTGPINKLQPMRLDLESP